MPEPIPVPAHIEDRLEFVRQALRELFITSVQAGHVVPDEAVVNVLYGTLMGLVRAAFCGDELEAAFKDETSRCTITLVKISRN